MGVEIKYKPLDIQGGPGASFETQSAAYYDYLQSVYFSHGQFDGVLTSQEQKFVRDRKMLIRSPQDIPVGIYYAKKLFFRKHPNRNRSPLCYQTDELTFMDRRFGRACVIGGGHGCFEQFKGFTHLELEMVAHPQDWILMIEAKGKDVMPEGIFFDRLSKVLQIPSYQPILPLHHDAVVQEFKASLGLDRLDLAASNVVMNLHTLGKLKAGNQKGDTPVNVEKLVKDPDLQEVIAQNAQRFAVTQDDLWQHVEVWLRHSTAENLSTLTKKVVSQYVGITNQVSVAHIQKIRKQHPKKEVPIRCR